MLPPPMLCGNLTPGAAAQLIMTPCLNALLKSDRYATTTVNVPLLARQLPPDHGPTGGGRTPLRTLRKDGLVPTGLPHLVTQEVLRPSRDL